MDLIGDRVRAGRKARGLSQLELAEAAGVSRATVGALEHGRHMPAADAAVRLARVLGTTVEELCAEPTASAPLIEILDGALPEGTLVRAARVGDDLVGLALGPTAILGGAAADGIMERGALRLFSGGSPQGAVIAGCDPLLRVAEGMLEAASDRRVVAVSATSGQALAALAAGRCHAALVHGPAATLIPPPGIRRWHVASWRSGIASHPRLSDPSLETLLGDDIGLIERDATAACQQAFGRTVQRLGVVRTPPEHVASSHVEATTRASSAETAAVTIEPVAAAMGLNFLALEEHDVELWVPDRWTTHPGVVAFLDLCGAPRFLDRASAMPAYDLTRIGTAA